MNKFSDIGHRNHLIDSPISNDKLNDIVEVLHCKKEALVLDIGCGKGELLLRLAQKYDICGTGLDISEERISVARSKAVERFMQSNVSFEVCDARKFALEEQKYDLIICMGAGSVFGGTKEMLTALQKAVCPGGLILIDGGFWKKTPDPEYLKLLSANPGDYGEYALIIRQGLEIGLQFLYGRESSQDEWDHFEGLYLQSLMRYLAENPDDEDSPVMRERIEKWRDGYYKWGRDTLGYGLYLFMKAQEAKSG